MHDKNLAIVNIREINKLLNGNILTNIRKDKDFTHAFASDLMSDLLCVDKEELILITGLSTMQTIRSAEMSGADCIVIARGKCVSKEMIDIAERNHTMIINTDKSVFNVSGILYRNGVKPVY